MSTYANVLQSSSCGIAPERSKKRGRTNPEEKRPKKSKTEKVLGLLHNEPSLKNRDIAEIVGCHEQFVSQVKKQKVMGEQPPWFQNHVSKVQEFEKPSLTLDQTIVYTSNLCLDVPLRQITEKELAEHKLNISEITEETLAAKKEFLRRRLFLGSCKESFHGFLEVETSMREDDLKKLEEILHKKLPALLASTKHGAAAAYEKVFAPIFEYVQLAPLGPGQKRGDDDQELDRRMGDKKRSQAKLSDLLETAVNRVKAVQDAVEKSTLRAGRMGKKKSGTKKNRNLIKKLVDVKKEEELILDLHLFMRKHYHYIREVQNTISMLKDKILIPLEFCRCGRQVYRRKCLTQSILPSFAHRVTLMVKGSMRILAGRASLS
jgi:hypothetical protein